jgi:hypothetical protein
VRVLYQQPHDAVIGAGSGKSGPIHSGNSGRSSTKQKR